MGLHLLARRDRAALRVDMCALSVAGTVLSLAHPAALGWHPSFPAPSPAAYFFPYFATILLGTLHSAGLLLGLLVALRTAEAPGPDR